jgi:DNA-directed RNA polymerase subunit M/transcription elongation factor TFIIS
MSSFFNEKQIEAFTTGQYWCKECGSLMEFEDEDNHDILICPSCGAETDVDHYGFDSDEEYEALYPTREEVLGEEDEEDGDDE